MRCIVDEDFEKVNMFGDYNSGSASNLVIAFDLCNTETSDVQCEKREEIEQWMARKYFMVLTNHSRFITHEFHEKRMQNRSKLFWYPLSHRIKVDSVMMIQRTSQELNDGYINLSSLNREYEKGFNIDRLQNRDMPYNNTLQNAVTYFQLSSC